MSTTRRTLRLKKDFPTIVCLCGSTRFMQAFQEAALRETLTGRIVLTVGCDTKSDAMLDLSPEVKEQLDALHFQKIDLADEILVLNVGGYIGESTSNEMVHALMEAKEIRFLEPVSFEVHQYSIDLEDIYWMDSDDDIPPPSCDHSTCSEEARWWRDEGREGGWLLCDRHVYGALPVVVGEVQV